jgi:hypothetical protein
MGVFYFIDFFFATFFHHLYSPSLSVSHTRSASLLPSFFSFLQQILLREIKKVSVFFFNGTRWKLIVCRCLTIFGEGLCLDWGRVLYVFNDYNKGIVGSRVWSGIT